MRGTVRHVALSVACAVALGSATPAHAANGSHDAAIAAFIEACLSSAPSFGQAGKVFKSKGIRWAKRPSENLVRSEVFALTGPMTSPAKGAVCNVTIRGDADDAAQATVAKFLESGALGLKGKAQRNVVIDSRGSVAGVFGTYKTAQGTDFEVFVSESQTLPGIGRVTSLGALERK